MTFNSIEFKYRTFLAQQGKLFTQERATILHFVLSRKDHFSTDELLFYMQKKGIDVSRATLYRNLKSLVDAQILVEVDFGHGHTHYECIAVRKPHDHLICHSCKIVIEVQNKSLQKVIQAMTNSQNFHLDHYQLQIYGLCKKCAEKENKISKVATNPRQKKL